MNVKIIFQILIFSTFINANCQTQIEAIFLKIKFSNINNSDKVSLIKNQKIFKQNDNTYSTKSDIPEHKKNEFYSEFELKEFLPKSGFLSFNENYINADGGYHYDLCYWNTSKSYKLIAVKYYVFATMSYDELDFYTYQQDSIKKVDITEVLPKLEFEDLINVDYIKKDGLDKTELLKLFQEISVLEYKLPKQGKSIIVQSTYKWNV